MTAIILTVCFSLVLLTLVVWSIAVYNRIILLKNQVKNAWSSVDVMLMKRFDLIPQLTQVVKQYMSHESQTLSELVALRNATYQHKHTITHENTICEQMATMVLKAEAYPELRSSEQFLQLQKAMNEAEAHIAAARRFFNAAVTHYNQQIQSFPQHLLASMMGFKTKHWFESHEDFDVQKEVLL
jgi:LemA protein